ncbi:MAG: hypothetical protein EOP06_10630 [Proteobacteria bacterium]|nr:MAG: hypothetical protein EOP06_10630 [Pseudomonadota bacterium]
MLEWISSKDGHRLKGSKEILSRNCSFFSGLVGLVNQSIAEPISESSGSVTALDILRKSRYRKYPHSCSILNLTNPGLLETGIVTW